MNLADTAFAREEFRHFLLGALGGFDAEWHSRPEALDAASYKPGQLAWAMGDDRLTVPQTLVTSSPAQALAFLGADPTAFVAKPLSGGAIETAQGFDAIPTARVTPSLVDAIADLRNAPCILQRFVPRKFDVRLNVVGEAVFATRLDTHGAPEAEADSRRVFYTDMGYAIVDPPDQIADACRAMCRHFGITFGAFDFAIDGDDRWQFLELNPYGQWAWVEEMTGMPIAAAFADLFIERLSATGGRASSARAGVSSPGARRAATPA